MKTSAALAAGLFLLGNASQIFAQANAAQGKPVTASGPLWPGFPASNLTDGNVSTFAHPQASSGTLGFRYQIDLLNSFNFTSLRVYNRHDCCPERLTNYRVSLHNIDEGTGQPGAAHWTADIRTNNTNSGMGGVDVLPASLDPAGTFSGRIIRIENRSNQAYNPQIAEVQAMTDDIQVPNVALYKTVTSSAATLPGYPAANLTDGNPTSFSHPQASAGTTGFFYQIDLANTFVLDRIILYPRNDGCCPERLRRYRVQLLDDMNGLPGPALWSGDFRLDGTFPQSGEAETIRVEGGSGTFSGRFIRISNLSGEAYNPQLGEVEAFRAPTPRIRFFGPDSGNISHGTTAGLPPQAMLSWIVDGATALTLDNGVGAVSTPTGNVTVSPAATTTYTLTATNAVGSTTKTVTIGVDEPIVLPRLSEFVADNGGSLEDEDGSTPDWIEIKNPNTFTLNLAGWHLTDSAANKTKWQFPAAAVPPGGFLMVFASEKDRATNGGPLHTNFQLSKNGEYLGLVGPDGTTIATEFAEVYPEQKVDVSYGLDGTGQARYFKPSTPGEANPSTGYTGFVADTSFALKRGFYESPQQVAITSATAGATIRYTTNGAKPTVSTGSIYSGPIAVSTTTTLRAAAFLDGLVPANVDTHTYIFPASVISTTPWMAPAVVNDPIYGPQMTDALKDVPSVSLVLPNTSAINDDSEAECSFEFIYPDNSPGGHANAGIHYYGGAFTGFAKKNFRLHFRGIYGDRKFQHPIFAGYERGWKAVDEFDGLELRGGSHDMAERGFYMSNIFCDDALLEMGQLQPHGRFVHLYLNGVYWGLFHLRERWDASMLANYLGGQEEDYEAINGNYNVGGWPEPGSPYDGDGHAWQRVKTLRSNYPGVQPFVDVDNYLDYMIAWMFGNAEDEYRAVAPTRQDGGSGFKFYINDADGWLSVNASNQIAVWDGNDNNTGRAGTIPGRQPGDGPASLLSAWLLSGGTDFKIRLADRIHRHLFNGGALTPPRNASRLTELCTAVQRAFLAEAARWNYRSPASWSAARNVCLNQWIPSRTNTVITQFRNAGLYPTVNAPIFSQHGGSVPENYSLSITGPAGATSYYTTDGSDPRLPGDGISPSAVPYSSPVPLSRNSLVKARSKNGPAWSALNEAFFQVGPNAVPPGTLVVSELFFNPDGDNDAEFIELMNVSDGALNLRGCRFIQGIDFTFSTYFDTSLAPGQRLILVDSDYAFRGRFGWSSKAGGIYSDNLNNDGEAVTFVAADGTTTLLDFTFSETWWRIADGGGHSLTLIDPHVGIDLANAANWRPSRAVGGSPNSNDAVTFPAANPDGDDDGDGFSNFIHYALAGPQPLVLPTAQVQPDASFVVTLQRHVGADDAVVALETSNDLGTWLPSAGATLLTHTIANAISTETWRLPSPAGTRNFIRLRVTQQ
ncbi:MAG: lamin tail domain-containing protein [Verrucomicrobiales bacterium]